MTINFIVLINCKNPRSRQEKIRHYNDNAPLFSKRDFDFKLRQGKDFEVTETGSFKCADCNYESTYLKSLNLQCLASLLCNPANSSGAGLYLQVKIYGGIFVSFPSHCLHYASGQNIFLWPTERFLFDFSSEFSLIL